MKSPPYLVWVLPLISIRASVQYRQEDNTKRVNHPRVCPMLHAMPYVHLNPNHNNRTKYSILELNWHVSKCKCLNRFKSVQLPFFSSLIIAVCNQSKQESNSTDPIGITMNTAQHNKIHNDHKTVAFPRQMSRFRDISLEAGSLLSRAGRCKVSVCFAMLRSCKDCPAHQNREENVNKNMSLNHSHPRQRRQKFDRGGTSTWKCVYYEISVKASVLMFPRYFRYTIGSTGRIHRDGRR